MGGLNAAPKQLMFSVALAFFLLLGESRDFTPCFLFALFFAGSADPSVTTTTCSYQAIRTGLGKCNRNSVRWNR